MKTKDSQNKSSQSSLMLYQTEDNQTRIEVRLEDETVWLTQKIMAELFQKDVRTINEHIQNLFQEHELNRDSVIRNFRITAADGKSYDTLHYNLDAIISVGYRVKSHRGTQFRRWATERLREYLVKGFVMDDERLKEGRTLGADYFDELLERIREIRASEKRFYRKIRDIYKLSCDYDPTTKETLEFFKTVQNKLHWAVTGHTAAELISARADSSKPNKGPQGRCLCCQELFEGRGDRGVQPDRGHVSGLRGGPSPETAAALYEGLARKIKRIPQIQRAENPPECRQGLNGSGQSPGPGPV